MKFKRVFPMGIIALSTLSAQALEVQHSGHFRIRPENYKNFEKIGRKDKTDFTTMRLRLGLELKLDDKRSVYIAPQAVKTFGEPITQPQADGSVKNRQSSGDKYDSDLNFHEAYAITSLGSVQMKLGRQEFAYGDKIVLGNRNWTPNGQAFDAIKATTNFWKGSLDLVYSKIVNADASSTVDDATLLFLYWKAVKQKDLHLDFYAISNNKAMDGDNNDSVSYGFRYKQNFGNFGFRTENIFQELTEQDENEFNYNLVLDYDFGAIKTFATYMVASTDYDQLYVNRHKYNGIADVVGRKNLKALSVGLSADLGEKWKLKAEGFQFTKFSDDALAYNQPTSGTLPGNIDENDIGQELDLILNYYNDKNEVVSLGYSVFKPGEYFTADQENATFAYMQYLLKF